MRIILTGVCFIGEPLCRCDLDDLLELKVGGELGVDVGLAAEAKVTAGVDRADTGCGLGVEVFNEIMEAFEEGGGASGEGVGSRKADVGFADGALVAPHLDFSSGFQAIGHGAIADGNDFV